MRQTDQKKVAAKMVSVFDDTIAELTDLVQSLQVVPSEQGGGSQKLPANQKKTMQGILQIWDDELKQMDVLLEQLDVFFAEATKTDDDMSSRIDEYLREDDTPTELMELMRSCVNALGAMRAGIFEVHQSVRGVEVAVVGLSTEFHVVKQSCDKLDQLQRDVEILKNNQPSRTSQKQTPAVARKPSLSSRTASQRRQIARPNAAALADVAGR